MEELEENIRDACEIITEDADLSGKA